MTRWNWLAASLALVVAVAGAEPAKRAKATACSGHGTSLEFFDTPSAAATQAKKDQKLVFVLHVSGNFEDPRFT